jgi:glycosyltransferase involved in cell wall biosynthesis
MMGDSLLWVAGDRVLPADSGGRQRTLALLTAAAGRYAVTVCQVRGPSCRDLPASLPVEQWQGAPPICQADQVAALPTIVRQGMPPHLRHFVSPRQRTAVREALARGRFDVVVADTLYASAAVPAVSEPFVIVTHNVEDEVWHGPRSDVSGGPLRLLLDRSLIGSWERRTLARADGVAFCSDRDRGILSPSLAPGAASGVVVNAVDTDRLLPLTAGEGSRTLLFVGSLDYGPNAEAAAFIRSALAPRLARRGYEAAIVGGEGTSGPGYRFAGRPDDLVETYAAARAVIVPLFHGSGTRLKVLEAFALGRPLIATSKAVEGLDVRPGTHYLAAETAAGFEARLLELDASPELGPRLAEAARSLVVRRYSFAAAGEAFLKLLDDARAAAGRRPLRGR